MTWETVTLVIGLSGLACAAYGLRVSLRFQHLTKAREARRASSRGIKQALVRIERLEERVREDSITRLGRR